MYEPERGAIDGPALQFTLASELPPNSTLLEYDIAAVTNRTVKIDFDLHKKLDPATCDMTVLPFLAWGRTMTLWDEDWSDQKKRSIVLKARFLHLLTGTEAGIREHVRYADATLKKVVAPPIQVFPSKSLTKAEREKFLSVMPQLRLYRYKDRGSARGKVFCTRNPIAGRAFGGRSDKTAWSYRWATTLTDAQIRVGTRAFIWDKGELTPLTTATVEQEDVSKTATNTYLIKRKGSRGRGFFPGLHHGLNSCRPIAGGVKLQGSVYTVTVDEGYVDRISDLVVSSVQPSLTPVDARFNYVQEHGTARRPSLFPNARGGRGQVLHGRFLPPSTARDRLYQQMYLFDPTRGVPQRKGRCYAGNFRLGIKPFHAELDIEITNKRLRNSFGDFVRGFLHKTPTKKLDTALRAVRVSKAARDKTTVRLGLRQIPTMGHGLPLDTDYRFGDRIADYK